MHRRAFDRATAQSFDPCQAVQMQRRQNHQAVLRQGLAGVDYAIPPTLVGRFGFRYLTISYHRHDFLYDVATGGLYAGIGARF